MLATNYCILGFHVTCDGHTNNLAATAQIAWDIVIHSVLSEN